MGAVRVRILFAKSRGSKAACCESLLFEINKKKFLSRVGGGGLDRPSPTLLDQPIVFIDIISSNIIFGSDKQ